MTKRTTTIVGAMVTFALAVCAWLPLLNVNDFNRSPMSADSGAVLRVENMSRSSIKKVVFNFAKGKSVTAINFSSVLPHRSSIVFLNDFSGEFAVTAQIGSSKLDCIDYWSGWPTGFSVRIERVEPVVIASCANAQWVDRYSIVDWLIGHVPSVDEQYTVARRE